jgi:hypothetical protein
MHRFVNRQGFGESGDRALGGDVGRGVQLAHASNQAREVDDTPARQAQVRQSKLTGGKDANQIQIKQIAKLL